MTTRGSMDLVLQPGARMPKGRPYYQKDSSKGKTEQKKGQNRKSKGGRAKKVMKGIGPRKVSV